MFLFLIIRIELFSPIALVLVVLLISSLGSLVWVLHVCCIVFRWCFCHNYWLFPPLFDVFFSRRISLKETCFHFFVKVIFYFYFHVEERKYSGQAGIKVQTCLWACLEYLPRSILTTLKYHLRHWKFPIYKEQNSFHIS